MRKSSSSLNYEKEFHLTKKCTTSFFCILTKVDYLHSLATSKRHQRICASLRVASFCDQSPRANIRKKDHACCQQFWPQNITTKMVALVTRANLAYPTATVLARESMELRAA